MFWHFTNPVAEREECGSDEPSFEEVVPSEDFTLRQEPKEEGNLWAIIFASRSSSKFLVEDDFAVLS